MDSFQTFYKQQKERFFGYLLRMTADFELARDLMQESFTRYLVKYGYDHPKAALLFTIGRNALLDHIRKKRQNSTLDQEPVDNTYNQEQIHLIKESYQQVLAAMELLPSDEREILSLVVSSDLNYKEIAAIIGITEANVKVKVHRARMKLKKRLATGEQYE
jgi:RNA polymerase sigma-70 factor (ECF subfamily)